jgi:membrane protein implicated in regulation of membrane protease activity
VLGVVFRESRYRWGALLLFGVVTYRAFTQFQDLTPAYQVLVFGVPGVVLIVVSWAYSRRTLRNKKRGQTGPPAPTDG